MSPAHQRPRRRLGRRAAVVALGATALLVGPVAVAEAHVHVGADTAVVGADATLTFRVPTESEAARTVKIVVTLPSDHPLLSVAPQAVAGWTATVTTSPLPAPVEVEGTTLTEAPHRVIWTATAGGGIPPEQVGLFGLLVEGLPDATELAFPTTQYYSDGTSVAWDQPTPAGGSEPEHPLPTLQLVQAATTSADTGAPAPAGGTDTLSRWLSVVAIVLSGLTLAAILRRRPGPMTGGAAG